MKKKDRVKLQRKIKQFALEFIEKMKNYQQFRQIHDMEINTCLFNMTECHKVVAIVSESDKQIMLVINKSEINQYEINFISGDIMDFYDKFRVWKSSNTAFRIESSIGIKLNSIQIKGLKPFKITGKNVEVQFEDFSFEYCEEQISLDFGFIFSIDTFETIYIDKENYYSDIIKSYYIKKEILLENYDVGIGANTSVEKVNKYKEYLKSTLATFKKLTLEENTPELVIDNFISNNSIILEIAFGIDLFKRQVILKDFSDRFKQDLKPDLIGFKSTDNRWYIVDYKKSGSKIIKNNGDVRESFKAEVNDLKAQLKDYIEYFDEKCNRDYYKTEYGDLIEYPYAIGLIGIIEPEYTRAFERQVEDIPRKYEIIPFNYVYNRLCKFVERFDIVQ